MSYHDRQTPSASSPPNQEEDLFLDILHEAPLSGQRKRTRILGSILYCFLLAGYAVVAAAAPWIFVPIPRLIPPLLCSCNVVLMIITGIFQQYLVYQVRKVRLQVPLFLCLFDIVCLLHRQDPSSSIQKHLCLLIFWPIELLMKGDEGLLHVQSETEAHCPPSICHYCVWCALCTAAMLLVMVWQPHIKVLSVSTLLRIIIFGEVICAGSFMSLYIGCVHQYNSLDCQPDVLKSLYSSLQPSSPLEELRYHDGGRLSDQQMALLQYQRENLHYLSEEVLRLQECLSKYERSADGSTPQVDLAHLLAARDQELRALSAEMNQIQSELHLARKLIAERDSEVQRIRTTNNQYVEENERLRAILGEWSTRAAKLERALEAERLSNMELQKKITRLRSHPTQTSEEQGD